MTLNQKQVKAALASLDQQSSAFWKDSYEAALRNLEEAMQMIRELAENGADAKRWLEMKECLRAFYGKPV